MTELPTAHHIKKKCFLHRSIPDLSFDRNHAVVLRGADRLDIVENIYLKIEVAPLPDGYKWRPDARLRFLTLSTVYIGPEIKITSTSTCNRIRHMQQETAYYHDDLYAPMLANTSNTIIIPITNYWIPIVSHPIDEVTVYLRIAELNSLVTQDDSALDRLTFNPVDATIVRADLCISGILLNPQGIHRWTKFGVEEKIVTYDDFTCVVPTNSPCDIQIRGDREYKFLSSNRSRFPALCAKPEFLSDISILVEQPDESSIPIEAVSKIRYFANGILVLEVSGYESRYICKNHMLNSTGQLRANINSQNLYFLPTRGTTEFNIASADADFDVTHTIQLVFKPGIVSKVRVSLMCADEQMLVCMSGVVGLSNKRFDIGLKGS
jgi:hypothetical protein